MEEDMICELLAADFVQTHVRTEEDVPLVAAFLDGVAAGRTAKEVLEGW